ncbi:sodium:proton antiporter [Lentilactobacillus otakiensis]|uniref:CPA1 family monovalent cation:proton (H+) antiporter-1 n=1 Tax=Lentilactobacillus otakiensis DSM 19908 = JCM 15040 TaxID=1423780 RepID=S4NGF1_9LACO|nr:sodium:proton antiporter [Lentilactobacillus otakiensis]KRL10253.1 Na+ H+ antiporter [Lentilactobacillus otakiensis DSM 19908 = JCM 15040]MBZ3777357.1 sodium:proton antiporter [Lentilactobacillus otakiensis]MDV3518615.1 sodium:proton antiporter [Lentilactobacillus otakiensis]GAD16327.1 CPA1 family monovalent cation:proton (H+) antiporter-1 [Lentilactobacillus otakiensis DSM 19908 = JCM 15040]
MLVFYSLTLLIVATIIANIIYTNFPAIPLTFYQIGCGLLLSLLPFFQNYSLEPEIFMLMVIAPLMFNDGQNTSGDHFRHSIRQILNLAVFLAVATAVIIGVVAHLLLPLIPLALCFAVAAIVTPTDSVAFQSITKDIKLPTQISGALENESLFNDASGIVIFNLALASFITGDFSFTEGLTRFLISFFGGLLVGAIAGSIFVKIQTALVNKSMDTASVIVPFSIMTPIAIYLLSEELGCSGILAVVAAGIIYGINQSRLKLTSTNVRLVTNATWGIISSLLNGVVFVLLGVTLPKVIKRMIPYSNTLTLQLVFDALAIYLVMLAIRFIWMRLNLFHVQTKDATNKEALISAIGGVHGTITLAMALSIPLTSMGQAFPFRDQLIFISTIVILLSLIVPTILLPILCPKKEVQDNGEFDKYRAEMVNYAIAQVKLDPTVSILDRNYVIDMLNSQKNNTEVDRKQVQEIMTGTQQASVQAVVELANEGKIEQKIADAFSRRMITNSNSNIGITKRLKYIFKYQSRRFRNRKKVAKVKQRIKNTVPQQKRQQVFKERRQTNHLIKTAMFKGANDYLDQIENDQNSNAVNFVRSSYSFRQGRSTTNAETDTARNTLLIKSFQFEYSYVADTFKAGKISRSLSDQLSQSISTDQMAYMEQDANNDLLLA